MTALPQRLQFFASFGFDMAVVSDLTNGLPARKICGATNFSNCYDAAEAPAQMKVALFRDMLRNRDSRKGRWVLAHVRELAGHNLFCTCSKGAPCHGDILIALANGLACDGLERLVPRRAA